MISTRNIPSAIDRLFTTVTVQSEKENENSKTLFGKYPYSQGTMYSLEDGSRSIENFSNSEKLGLKTIIAHMCEVGSEIATTSQTIFKCEEGIKYAQEKVESEIFQQFYCSLAERELVTYKSQNAQLLLTMNILVALLIKESYCLDQKSRALIIDFLISAKILAQLDKATDSAGAKFGFQSIYYSSSPCWESGLLSKAIEDKDQKKFIPIFALNSHELKPKALPDELENDWPFPVEVSSQEEVFSDSKTLTL